MPVFVHYEDNVTTVTGEKVVRLLFSSSKTHYYINNKMDGDTLKSFVSMLKQIPSNNRHYEPTTNMWYIPTVYFNEVINLLFGVNYKIKHPDLNLFRNPPKQSWNDYVERGKTEIPRPEDFFYNNSQPVGATKKTLTDIEKSLASLFDLQSQGVSSIQEFQNDPNKLKKVYRQACMRLHPDRNNGDGSKMSELNSLLDEWKKLTGIGV